MGVKVVPSRRLKLFLNPEILTEQSVGQFKSKNHKKRVGQRRKFETMYYIGSLHRSYGKTSTIGVLYAFFQYLIRAELYSLRKTSVLENTKSYMDALKVACQRANYGETSPNPRF